MTYRKAREFASVVYGDEGKDTLTARNGKRALTRLLMQANCLDKLEPSKADDEREAAAAIDDLLISPVLKRILCGTENKFSLRDGRASIGARLDRADWRLRRTHTGLASHFAIQGANCNSRLWLLRTPFSYFLDPRKQAHRGRLHALGAGRETPAIVLAHGKGRTAMHL